MTDRHATVDRRRFLLGLGGGGLAALAGCGAPGGGAQTDPSPSTPQSSTEGPETPTSTGHMSPTTMPTTGTSTPGGQVVDVAAGPEGRLRFDPETVEIAVGDTVRWTFESPGHNVTAKPGASEKVAIPEGAEPFASYEGDQHFAIVPVGATYAHTFTVPGEYVYVCAPHADQGMVGTVVVR